MMKPTLRSRWWLVMLLTLAFGLVFAAPAFADISTGTFQITLVDEAGNPLADYPVDYPGETRNLKYKYRYGGSWAPEVSFKTDAGGQTLVSIDPAHLATWDKKITVTLDQTSKEQDVRLDSTFRAAKVNVNLKSCAGPITALPGGTVAQGGGFWYTHGTTGPTGTVAFYAFPATVKVRMAYNHNSLTLYPAIVAGTNEVDFQTTKVTINYTPGTPDDIRSDTGGTWWNFSEPFMYLLPDDYAFEFKTGTTWGGRVTIAVSGCELFYPPLTNLPPEADAGGPYTGTEGSPVTLDASGSSDPDGDPLTYTWDLDNDGQHDDAVGPSPTWTFPDDGAFPVAVQVTDDDDATDTATATVTVGNVSPAVVIDPVASINEGGTCSGSGSFTDPGADSWTATVDYGDGSGVQTLALTGKTFSLSHLYADNGSYTVTVSVDDGDGEPGTATATVIVTNVAPTVGAITAPLAPVKVSTLINASAPFSDPGVLDTHSATWDWGDGATSAGTVTETDGSGSVSGSHAYTVPGVYTLAVTVTDRDGGIAQVIHEYVVVYDPSAGFVTGGGWINSPAGAYVADPSVAGKATFGFVAKYKKGATVPDGNTQFQFKAGDLNFSSSSYEWLVVAGNTAKFKGQGTINGQGTYKFMISGVDASPDTFRIQIWGDDGIVYDNGSQQALGGGSIVVHK